MSVECRGSALGMDGVSQLSAQEPPSRKTTTTTTMRRKRKRKKKKGERKKTKKKISSVESNLFQTTENKDGIRNAHGARRKHLELN